jgi:tripartite-type tricarboxylate transporter receptor subunit TctC
MSYSKTLLAAAAAAFAISAVPAQAQTYRMLVGYPPGGGTNLIARAMADKLGEALGRPVITDTRSGAAGQIAAEALKNSPPDGSSLLITPDTNITIYPHTVKKPVYQASDFVPVTYVAGFHNALGISSAIPAATLREFIDWTKASSKPAGYGSSGAGGSLHFYGVFLAQVTGARMEHVAYRGVGPALLDLAAGHVPAAVLPLGAFLPHVKSEKVRVLGFSGARRTAAQPDVPTFTELGYPALEIPGWYGVFAPAGTPPEILTRYNDIFLQAMRTGPVAELLRRYDLEPREMSTSEFAAIVKRDYERWGPIIKSSGFTTESQ